MTCAEVWALTEDDAIYAAADIGAIGLQADVTDPQAVAAALARTGRWAASTGPRRSPR